MRFTVTILHTLSNVTYIHQIVIYYSKIIIDHCFILKQTALWKTNIHFNKLNYKIY